jgi:hypothetical protein
MPARAMPIALKKRMPGCADDAQDVIGRGLGLRVVLLVVLSGVAGVEGSRWP